jgi:hypothetical protein
LAQAGIRPAVAATTANTDFTYPTNPDDLTGAWLADAIQRTSPDIEIVRADQSRIIWGTATKVFFDIEYRRRSDGTTGRETLCVKGAFDERMRNYYDLSVLYTTEAAFYRDIAPQVEMALPKCWLAIEDSKEGIVALEDIGAKGARFVEASESLTPDQCREVLDSLASLHAATWGWQAGRFPWITLGSGAQRGGNTAMMEGDRFDDLTRRPEVLPHLPPELSDRDTVLAALRRMWAEDDVSPGLCLCHGDIHLGQTYVDAGGRMGIIDWQSAAIMPWAKDVAYFIGGALPTDERRACERDLLEHYLRALEARGGPRIDRVSAWRDYRRQMLVGMVWPVVTENMQPIAAIATMSQRCLTAMRDIGTLAAFDE